MTRVAVVGASGFVGSHVHSALVRRGAEVIPLSAPRVETRARQLTEVLTEVEEHLHRTSIRELKSALGRCDAVINAAGVAAATDDGDALFGANAVLPGLLAGLTPHRARFVHVSSAAVQGRCEVLDESERTTPFSPYSSAKALGETAVHTRRSDAVCYRPTSVHGAGREVTRSLVRFLRSPLASVAGAGDRPTPQIQVQNVGDAAGFLATAAEAPPRVVLHPSEGMTTGELVRVLGGHEPRHVPMWLARTVIGTGFVAARLAPPVAGISRRLEMLWFGQEQGRSWLDGRWVPSESIDTWKELA